MTQFLIAPVNGSSLSPDSSRPELAFAYGILLLAGCVGQPVVASYPQVPAARVEVIPQPPREREQPGHWHWDGYG